LSSFDGRSYWNDRLTASWSLAGTGHQQYSAGYNRWLYRAKRRALRRALGPLAAGSALDVGSGTGWVLRELVRAGWQVAGCDVVPVAVERLHRELPGISMALVDAGRDRLPAPDGSLDLVSALDVVYHLVEHEAFSHLLAEVGRVLRPGGVFVASDTLSADDVVPAEHVHFRSAERWRTAAEEAGLVVERLLPYFRRLSRPTEASRLRFLPDAGRGALEFAADVVAPGQSWMHLAVLRAR